MEVLAFLFVLLLLLGGIAGALILIVKHAVPVWMAYSRHRVSTQLKAASAHELEAFQRLLNADKPPAPVYVPPRVSPLYVPDWSVGSSTLFGLYSLPSTTYLPINEHRRKARVYVEPLAPEDRKAQSARK